MCLVSLPSGLGELFGDQGRFRWVGENERWRRKRRRRRRNFVDGLVRRTRFKGERGVEVAEVSQPFFRRR